MSEGRCGSGENALRQQMESRSDQGSPRLRSGQALRLSVRFAHLATVRMTKQFFAEAREECKSGVRKIGQCPRCPILDMLCFEGVMQPKGHSLESC